jgi:hypothetical protein
VDGHQLHAAIAADGWVGLCGQLVEGRVDGWAQQVLLAGRKLVQRTPQEVEICAGGAIDALGATEAKPDLLEPGSNGCGGQIGTLLGRGVEGFKNAVNGALAGCAEERRALDKQLRDGSGEKLRIVGASE